MSNGLFEWPITSSNVVDFFRACASITACAATGKRHLANRAGWVAERLRPIITTLGFHGYTSTANQRRLSAPPLTSVTTTPSRFLAASERGGTVKSRTIGAAEILSVPNAGSPATPWSTGRNAERWDILFRHLWHRRNFPQTNRYPLVMAQDT